MRERVAARADLTPHLLQELARDPDDEVRRRALLLPLPRTWWQRDAVDRIIGRTADTIGYTGDRTAGPDTSWYEQCATSEHPLLRRVAATCPHLREDLALRLTDDPDTDVRHLLAYHHRLAPPALLLDAFIATPHQRLHRPSAAPAPVLRPASGPRLPPVPSTGRHRSTGL